METSRRDFFDTNIFVYIDAYYVEVHLLFSWVLSLEELYPSDMI